MCQPSSLSSPPPGSRRRKLWELSPKLHCLLIGVCFECPDLRQLLSRSADIPRLMSDYELHRYAVGAAAARGKVGEQLHKVLEKRNTLAISHLKGIHTRTELVIRWKTALASGDAAATLWAVLTHPHCDQTLAEDIYGEMHMLQHRIGGSERRETAQQHALQRENVVLLRELASVQRRASDDRDRRVAEIRELNETLARAQGENAGLNERLADTQSELIALRASLPDLSERERLARRARSAEAQCKALRAHAQEVEQRAERWERHYRQLLEEVRAMPEAPARVEESSITLDGRQVLCIGGRPGVIEFYRQMVEGQGGRFIHHDGGMEENISLLEPSIAAADAVICQTGCVSHNAYWRVKDFCKRTGKPCVFVKSAGVGSFQRGLSQLLAPATEEN